MSRTLPVARLVLVILILLAVTGPAAQATLPEDQVVQYVMREVPDDPESPVVFGVELWLKAVSIEGNTVTWEVSEVWMVEVNSNGEAVNAWSESTPWVDTPSGLWLIEHAEPEAPELAEFDAVPLIAGTAQAVETQDPDLDYRFEGETCDESCRQLFEGNVTALDYEFALAAGQALLDASVGPVMIDDDELPVVVE
jgi:hypothetical protein